MSEGRVAYFSMNLEGLDEPNPSKPEHRIGNKLFTINRKRFEKVAKAPLNELQRGSAPKVVEIQRWFPAPQPSGWHSCRMITSMEGLSEPPPIQSLSED